MYFVLRCVYQGVDGPSNLHARQHSSCERESKAQKAHNRKWPDSPLRCTILVGELASTAYGYDELYFIENRYNQGCNEECGNGSSVDLRHFERYIEVAVLGCELLYAGIVWINQVDSFKLEKRVPPLCMFPSGVTQVEVSVTTICRIGEYP